MTFAQNPDAPWSSYITTARVLELHDDALHRYGGPSGPSDPSDCVDASLGAALSAEMYLEGRRHIKAGLPFAAYVLTYLARRHCFVDGNKRVAWAACTDVLAALGLGVDADDDAAEAVVLQVISGEIDGPDVAAWLASRLFALP